MPISGLLNLGLVNIDFENWTSCTVADNPIRLLSDCFEPGATVSLASVPGRVNLIGEHIDYHDLPVLPMAIQRRIRIAFCPRADARVRAMSSSGYGEREFDLSKNLEPGPTGDWVNYIKAAAKSATSRWPLKLGIDAVVFSDLPPAAGLASSSALLVGFTLALLQANCIRPDVGELMEILPDGEQFVGTRGGGMDHAAVLASRAGCALLAKFAPLELTTIPVPPNWRFLVAHSLTMAEKSGAVRAEYNARRTAGTRALAILGLPSYQSALEQYSHSQLRAMMVRARFEHRIAEDEFRAFVHVTGEARRVDEAVSAMRQGDAHAFGQVLSRSHASLRDNLRVSSPALDELVSSAMAAGALGARLTGAGFGGCTIILCGSADCDRIRNELVDEYYAQRPGFNPDNHLIVAEPSAGALYDTSIAASQPVSGAKL
ncbi:MAG TPA: galactokinase family protein [Bryobacteraceae bacterium]|nr:galactokinase family protein [Bryobacteraceae bacterium]